VTRTLQAQERIGRKGLGGDADDWPTPRPAPRPLSPLGQQLEDDLEDDADADTTEKGPA
jgi:hypothetical protein